MTEEHTKQPNRNTWFTVLLVLSLTLNVLIVAAISWHHVKHNNAGGRCHHAMRESGGQWSSEERKELMAALKAHRPELAKWRQNIKAEYKNIDRIVASDSLDAEALEQALGQYQQVKAQAQQALHATLASVLSGVSDPKQRSRAVRRLLSSRSRAMGGGSRRHKPPHDYGSEQRQDHP